MTSMFRGLSSASARGANSSEAAEKTENCIVGVFSGFDVVVDAKMGNGLLSTCLQP